MKTRKFIKKLHLNKKTVADLNNGEMKGAYGGKECSARPCFETESCTQETNCGTCPITCGTCGETCVSFCTIVGNCC